MYLVPVMWSIGGEGEKKEASEGRASMFRMVLLVRRWTENLAEEFD